MNERDPKTFAIIGAAMEVHRELGCGFLEPVYQEALAVEFTEQGIPFQREMELPIAYKGHVVGASYRADFMCYDIVVVELKALRNLSGTEESQIINYLRASDRTTGLLLMLASRVWNTGVMPTENLRNLRNLRIKM